MSSDVFKLILVMFAMGMLGGFIPAIMGWFVSLWRELIK